MQWRHTWILAVLTLAGTAWFAWRDEMTAQPIRLGVSLLILVIFAALIFIVWTSVRERREGLRECWLLILGAFAWFALYPWIFQALQHIHWIRELLRRSAAFGFVSELFWYLVPIALVLAVMWLGWGRDWLNAYFLRFEFHLMDIGIIIGLAALTLLGMLLWFKFGASGSEGWQTFSAGKSPALLVAIGILSAVGNALTEEFWFRGFFLATFKRIAEALSQERLCAFADAIRDWLREKLVPWTVSFLILSAIAWTLAHLHLRIILHPTTWHALAIWLFALAWLAAVVHLLRSPVVAAISLQALAFGFIHFKTGIPHGWTGLILAFIWGYALGYWTLKRMSLWPAVILHAVTDLFIFFSVNPLSHR